MRPHNQALTSLEKGNPSTEATAAGPKAHAFRTGSPTEQPEHGGGAEGKHVPERKPTAEADQGGGAEG